MQGNKLIKTVGLIKGDLGEVDSLILPECMDIALLIYEQKLIDFIRHVNAKGAIIASISSTPSLLA